ncbi:MAG: AAA family ATPase, partial [Caldilineales bacterium]|nr:AAA family ATPase [Caldilineales bacterium]
KPVGALSGGMKQRLALGLALLAEPPILVLDEPTSNLDAAARDQFLSLLRDVKADGKTIIFTSHRLEEIEALADSVLVLADGRQQFRCPATELPERLGLRTTIKLRLSATAIQPALDLLQTSGYTASKNGTGVLVDVLPGEKARPISLLTQADIAVEDFEIE